jgi:succinate dehydrogenase / fumarate reductase iron-sulfur subunit
VKAKLRILRQDSRHRPETRRFEEFEVEPTPGATLATALFTIQANPVTLDGKRVAPVAFESACRGDGCGACVLLVNGQARSACRTPLEAPKRGAIRIEPLSKLPLVRDLIVDKSALDATLLERRAWLAPESVPTGSEVVAKLDACSRCGACLEACPEWGAGSHFVGAAVLGEVHRLDQLEPERGLERRRALMAPGGIADCAGARNCVEVCPEGLPLFDSILELNHQTTRHWLRALLRR